jgi:hypothetical protein
MEVRRETPKVIPQNEEHSIHKAIKDKSAAARDKLDPRTVASLEKSRALANLAGYSVHPLSEFQIGRVFKVLWSEPIAAGGTGITVPTMGSSGRAFHSVRRFLITNSRESQTICM